MEENQKKESFRKKAELLLHHLKPAASAFALGIGASLAATLLRTLFTQIIRFTVDHALLGETEGLPAFLLNAPAGQILVWCAAAAAAVALLEFGAGFGVAALRGSQNNDPFYMDGGQVKTRTNHAGGILGGITNGMPLVFRVAVKPTPSIAQPQDSVSLSRGENTTLEIHGRHDPCIVPRAVPCVEAAAAIAVCDALLEQQRRSELL